LITKFSSSGRPEDTEKLTKILEIVRERGNGADAEPSLYVAVIHAFIRLQVTEEESERTTKEKRREKAKK
jgi:hypothetical protein